MFSFSINTTWKRVCKLAMNVIVYWYCLDLLCLPGYKQEENLCLFSAVIKYCSYRVLLFNHLTCHFALWKGKYGLAKIIMCTLISTKNKIALCNISNRFPLYFHFSTKHVLHTSLIWNQFFLTETVFLPFIPSKNYKF